MQRILLPGVLAAAAAALIGAGWQIATRHGVTTTLGPLELAWLRYALPALLLAPQLWRQPWPSHLRPLHAAVLVTCGGLPFGLLVLAGARQAPAAHIGVFMAGAMPVFTVLACRLALGERVHGRRRIGLALLAGGIVTMATAGGTVAAFVNWRGDLLFLAAAAMWAAYTVALRGTGLSVWQAAGLVNASGALLLLLALPWLRPVRLLSAPWGDVIVQALCQGLLAGVLGVVTYTAAVRILGAGRASLSAAAVPLLTAAGAAQWLGEALDPHTLGAGLLVAAGIVLAALPPVRANGSKSR
jgi:drug/metabolite transporter (DMT)-like permease